MAKTFKQFRLDNVTATLPTTLEYGEEVYYTDANGNLTLWVGHSDGTAWPVCGYKEYVAFVSWEVGGSYTINSVLKSDFSTTTTIAAYGGLYGPGFELANSAWNNNNMAISVLSHGADLGDTQSILYYETLNSLAAFGTNNGATSGVNQIVSVRIFP
jgi:hypothetical protein